MVMDTVLCKAMLMHVAKNIQENIELLNEADGLGDSDHGTGWESIQGGCHEAVHGDSPIWAAYSKQSGWRS